MMAFIYSRSVLKAMQLTSYFTLSSCLEDSSHGTNSDKGAAKGRDGHDIRGLAEDKLADCSPGLSEAVSEVFLRLDEEGKCG